VAAFPEMTRNWAELKKEDFIKNFSLTFRRILYLIIPISFLMYILRSPIVNIIYKRGNFTENLAQLTSSSLGLFCFGIFASTLIPLVFRAFFSSKDTKTPTIVAVISVALNIILSFYFVNLLRTGGNLSIFLKNIFGLQNIQDISVLGLSLAFSIIYVLQFVLLLFFLRKKIGDFLIKDILISFFKIISASALMAIVVSFLVNSYLNLKIDNLFLLFLETITITAFGGLIYLFFTFIFRSPEMRLILKRLKKNNGEN